ncbi:MAG TPA: glycosyltransferase [Elusimicrobiales bacterium]|nr:glycosyltransferase [Elusimicrobiales bacterium]
MKIALCLLTWDEIKGCRHDVPLLDRSQFDEIYAVDGGSTDGTVEYLAEQGIPVYAQPRAGLNAAHIHAFEKCSADALVIFHPKGSVPVEETLRFRSYFEQGYDLVIASRNIAGARNEEDRRLFKPRKWFVFFLALCAAALFRREGPVIWDVLHGFRGVSVKAFRAVAPAGHGTAIDLELVSRGYKQRLRMAEFPVKEQPRLAGKSHFKALSTGAKLLKYLFQEALGG